jgi:hypothetical protein
MEQEEQFVREDYREFHPDLRCKVCGAQLYLTDHGNHQSIYHCSSPLARFWDFERGSMDENIAKVHWENSAHMIYLNVTASLE